MRTMDEEAFQAYFGDVLIWTTTLSDGSIVHLKPPTAVAAGAAAAAGAETVHVTFSSRLEYANLVEEARLNESKLQVGSDVSR